MAFLQQLDRNAVGRAHERHMAVARRTVDRHPAIHKALAGVVDVVDLVGEVTEVAALAIDFRVPVVGELDERRVGRIARNAGRAVRR